MRRLICWLLGHHWVTVNRAQTNPYWPITFCSRCDARPKP